MLRDPGGMSLQWKNFKKQLRSASYPKLTKMEKTSKYIVIRAKDGKVVPQPPLKSTQISNADLFRSAEFGLYRLREIKNSYVRSNISYDEKYPETLTKSQIIFLTTLFVSVDNFLHKSPLLQPNQHRITKAIRKDIKELKDKFIDYKAKLDGIGLPKSLNHASIKLIQFVIELTDSFYFIDSLMLDVRKLPNRPIDCTLRLLVDDIIIEYQGSKKTEKYPTFPYVKRALVMKRIDNRIPQLSARQYGNFKQWRDRGTYWWYIQP